MLAVLTFVALIAVISVHSQSASQIFEQFENKASCEALPPVSCHGSRGALTDDITVCATQACCQARFAKRPDAHFICCADVPTIECVSLGNPAVCHRYCACSWDDATASCDSEP